MLPLLFLPNPEKESENMNISSGSWKKCYSLSLAEWIPRRLPHIDSLYEKVHSVLG